MRNITAGEGITDDKVGVPLGYGMKGWIMPQKAGMISARVNDIALNTVASILAGKALEGSTSFTITPNTPDGELIAFGIGSVTIQLSTNSPLLTASINGGGSASFTVETNIPILGAEASIIGETILTISIADADILPTDDSPVLREATASMTFSGSLVPYAKGYMTGTTEDQGLTVSGITNSVWNAAAAAYNASGTMGEKLNGAGSAGNPWTEVIEAGYSAAEILRLLAAHAAGDGANLEGSNPSFKGLDGTTRITATYSAGTRTINSLDGEI